jgi:hypothetical protein
MLVSTPADDLPSDIPAAYTRSALRMSPRIANEFRALLPRYVTLIARGDWPSSRGARDCLDRLREAEWRATWPGREVAAFDGYFLALLETLLSDEAGPGGASFWEVFTMIARADPDMPALLALWGRMDTPTATLRVTELLEEIRISYATWRGTEWVPRWGLWCGDGVSDEVEQQVRKWLLSPQIWDRLEQAFFATENPAVQARLSAALARLHEVRSLAKAGGAGPD